MVRPFIAAGLVVFVLSGLVYVTVVAPNRGAGGDGANRLLVEAAGLVGRAEESDEPGTRAELYKRALDNLDGIVAAYPESDLAVRVATGQAVGALDREGVERLWRLSLAEDCFRRSDRQCLLEQALEFATMTGSPTDRADEYSNIADYMAQGGNYARALEVAALIGRPGDKAYALAKVALAQAMAGEVTAARENLDSAIELAEANLSTPGRGFALGAIGVTEFQLGEKARAKAYLRRAHAAVASVMDRSDRVSILYTIAFDQIVVGDVDGTAETLRSASNEAGAVRDSSSRTWALGAVATLQMKAGDRSGAAETLALAKRAASETSFGDHGYANLAGIAATETALGNGAAATRLAESIPVPLSRAYVLSSIAYEENRFGGDSGAHRTALAAFEALEAVGRGADPSFISGALATLASLL